MSLVLLALALLSGCSADPAELDNSASEDGAQLPLRVVVVDSPALANSINRAWRGEGGDDLQITSLSAAELLEKTRLPADLVIYPSAMLGPLVVAGHLQPLPAPMVDHTADAVQRPELASDTEVSWAADSYARSFGSPTPLLVYRRDIFEALQISPPRTWVAYQATLQQLESHRASLDGTLPEHVVAEPLAGQDAAVTLLARAASYVRHQNQYSGLFDYISLEPRIASPPFQRALGELKQSMLLQGDLAAECSSEDALHKVLDGRCWLAISWSSHAVALLLTEATSPAGEIGFSPLPGSRVVFNPESEDWEDRERVSQVPLLAVSGRLGSVATLAYDRGRASQLLFFLTSQERANTVSLPSPATWPTWQRQAASARGWIPAGLDAAASTLFGQAIEQASQAGDELFCLRIPGREEYLDSLAGAVNAAQAGAAADNALLPVADQWRQITERLGLIQQKQAYRGSLGLAP